MGATRSERTRVIADLAWLGGMIQVAFGTALLVGPEAPVVAATLAMVGGAAVMLAGTLVLFGVRTSWTVVTVAFVLSFGAAVYAAWVAAPYWRGALIVAALALGGLVVGWTQRRPAPLDARAGDAS
ncbi:hypothetical protein BCL57_001903 [Agromyces flavus]|uniref:SPW repeat-containing protein n=1 Tax=Agromyces flavus TaxID=589382 RepID=A0A1H1QFT2_9MICO|nr:hypothetical protein [Agromyces flavus]MCP2367744.1 hypothetical protein [Agromyces flavus]SDS22157.1 hypothetical protein SAMN04489721_0965 [Agromyces flavus]